MNKQVHVLCNHDALYAAIELKLNRLLHVRVIKLDSNPVTLTGVDYLAPESDLIIVAPVPPISDPMAFLARAKLLSCVGRVPVLIVSEQPSRPESAEKITYLNFPFDMDDLTNLVADILAKRRHAVAEHSL